MKGYEEYKISPIPWISRLPAHWDIKRGKSLYQRMQRPVLATDKVITCFRDGVVTLREKRRTAGFTESLKEIGYQGIRKGDLVIHIMDAFAGAIGVSDSDGKGTPVYNVCQAISDCNNEYYAYLLREMARSGYIQSLYRGIRERSSDFRFEVFATEFYPVPPRVEQEQIVRFLNWKVTRINQLIAVKKKQIAVLGELKGALVNEAVTHGIDSKTVMTDSGISWLGEIPAHWTVTKLRRILRPFSEKNHPELPLLSVVREQGVIVRDIEDKESNHNYIPDDLRGYKMVKKGQFAMNKMKAWQGSYGISEHTGIVSPAYYVFDVDFDNLPYFHYAIRSKAYVDFFARASDGIRVGQWDLSLQKMKEIPFIVPPKEEQKAIVSYIPKAFENYEKAIQTLAKSIALLSEYKQKIISDTVTGQINVCDIPVPEYESDREICSELPAEDTIHDEEEQAESILI